MSVGARRRTADPDRQVAPATPLPVTNGRADNRRRRRRLDDVPISRYDHAMVSAAITSTTCRHHHQQVLADDSTVTQLKSVVLPTSILL